MKNVRSSSAGKKESLYAFQEIVILGAGRFGTLAAKRLTARHPHAHIVLVDSDERRLQAASVPDSVEKIPGDALRFLENLAPLEIYGIVPAIPVHVAWRWLLGKLKTQGLAHPLPVPLELDRHVPHPMRTPTGTVYASYADFQCPDNCPEPAKLCTVTRKPRPGILHRVLRDVIVPGFQTLVLQSHQWAPGVGGYAGHQLMEVLDRIQSAPGAFIVATSCSCHAVIDALAWYGTERKAYERLFSSDAAQDSSNVSR